MLREPALIPRWRWPLAAVTEHPLPDDGAPGAFGAVRAHDVHTGVDLYCEPDAVVVAVEPGEVVAVERFTGPSAGSPWWLDTDAVLVEGSSGVVLYGELSPSVSVGDRVAAGQALGRARTVLAKDKGRPRTMLHLELYARGTRSSVWWRKGEPRPSALLDPSEALRAARTVR